MKTNLNNKTFRIAALAGLMSLVLSATSSTAQTTPEMQTMPESQYVGVYDSRANASKAPADDGTDAAENGANVPRTVTTAPTDDGGTYGIYESNDGTDG